MFLSDESILIIINEDTRILIWVCFRALFDCFNFYVLENFLVTIFKFEIFAAPAANKKIFYEWPSQDLNTLKSPELFICFTNGIFNLQLSKIKYGDYKMHNHVMKIRN